MPKDNEKAEVGHFQDLPEDMLLKEINGKLNHIEDKLRLIEQKLDLIYELMQPAGPEEVPDFVRSARVLCELHEPDFPKDEWANIGHHRLHLQQKFEDGKKFHVGMLYIADKDNPENVIDMREVYRKRPVG